MNTTGIASASATSPVEQTDIMSVMALEASTRAESSILLSPLISLSPPSCLTWHTDCDTCTSDTTMTIQLHGRGIKDGILHLGNTFLGENQVYLPNGSYEISFSGYTPTGTIKIKNIVHLAGECPGNSSKLYILTYSTISR